MISNSVSPTPSELLPGLSISLIADPRIPGRSFKNKFAYSKCVSVKFSGQQLQIYESTFMKMNEKRFNNQLTKTEIKTQLQESHAS